MSEEKREGTPNGEESGISVREIFAIIGKKIWYVLGGSLLITLAAVLIFMLAINPLMESDSMRFRIDYPLYSEGKYPDGSVFDYRSMISREVIEETKKSNSEFSSINVGSLIKNEGIAISAQKSGETEPYVYTISLKQSYFKGVDTQDFITALTDTFKSHVIVEQKVNGSFDFKLNPDIFERVSFKEQLELLSEQREIILKQYDSWIKRYSAGRIVKGKPLSAHRAEVTSLLSEDVTTALQKVISVNGYEYFTKSVTADEVEARVESLKAELKLDQAILEKLTQSNAGEAQKSSFASYATKGGGENDSSDGIVVIPGEQNVSEKLAYYSERVAILELQIAHLTEGSYDDMATEIATFGEEYLGGQLDKLNEKAETLKTVISAIYTTDTAVIFESQKVTSDGGVSLVIIGLAVLVVAFLVFAVIAYFSGRKQKNKLKSGPIAEDKEESRKE